MTKQSDNYRLDELYHLVKSRDEGLRANLTHSNFATFSHSIQTCVLKIAYYLPYL